MEPRLSADMQVKAIQRIAEAQGNFAAVVYKGDLISGSIVILGRLRSQIPAVFERFPSMDGGSEWQPSGPKNVEKEEDINIWLVKRRAADPDLWVIELDVATDEQLSEIIYNQG